MTEIEKFKMRRNRRLSLRGLPIFHMDAGSIHNNNRNNNPTGESESGGGSSGGGKEGGHGNTRLPYGIAKGLGLDTTGMTPREVWDMLKGHGITPEEEYGKLEKGEKVGEVKPTEPEVPPKTTFETVGGKTVDELAIESTDSYYAHSKYAITGLGDDGQRHKAVVAKSKEDLLYALKDAGVTSVKIGDEVVNPQTAKLPEMLFKVSSETSPTYISKIENREGNLVLVGVDGKDYKAFYSWEDMESTREEIRSLSGGKIDIAELDVLPEKDRDYLKLSDSFTDTYMDERIGAEYSKPEISHYYAGGYKLKGMHGGKKKIIGSFSTKEDLLLFMKFHGIGRALDPENKELVNVADIELPKVIGHDRLERTYYTKITVSKYKDSFVVKGVDLTGKSSKIHESPSYTSCIKYATEKMGASESDISVSKLTKKAAMADEAWKTSNKVESFTTEYHGTVGALRGSFDSGWELKGKSESMSKMFLEHYCSKEAMIYALKERGVERFKYTDKDGELKTAHPTKESFPEDTIPYRGEIYTKVRVDYDGTSYSGSPQYKVVGVAPDGKEQVLAARVTSIERAKRYLPDESSDKIAVTEDAKNAEELARKEKEERERFERERKEAEERARAEKAAKKAAFEAREREAVLKEPEKYHMFRGNALGDVKVVLSGRRTTIIGTDIDGKSHTIDSTYGDYSDFYTRALTDAGFKDIAVEKSKRFSVEDSWGDTVVASEFHVKRTGSGFAITFEGGSGRFSYDTYPTEEEAEQVLKSHGVDSYYKSDGSIVGKPSRVWGTPTDGMRDAVIKKGKDGKYTVTAHSDKAGGQATVYTGSSAEECKKWLEDNNVDACDVPVITPNPNDDIIRIHSAVSLKNFDSHRATRSAKSFVSKMSENEKTECAEMLTEIFKSQSFRMVRSSNSFAKIVENGFLSQIETHTAGAGASTSRSSRKDASLSYFGESRSTADHDYEKYGYIDSENDDDTDPPFYGGKTPMLYKFKRDAVKDRTTYTMGDSLNTSGNAGCCAGYAGDAPTIEGIASSSMRSMREWLKKYKEFKDGSITSKQLFDFVKNTLNNDYIEAQYHGELTIADVESVCFQKKDLSRIWDAMDSAKRIATVKKLKENNVAMLYRESGGKYNNDVYDWLKKTYPDDVYD